MAFIDSIKKRAKQNKKTIVLPETADMRTLEAAHKILQEGIADIILVGDKQTIIKKADGLDLTGAKFVDPYDCDKLNDYVSILVLQLRRMQIPALYPVQSLRSAMLHAIHLQKNSLLLQPFHLHRLPLP